MEIIKCPKCGFEQPPDSFCAKCGLNIQQYQKSWPHRFQAFWTSPRIQIPLFLFLLISGSFWLYSKGPKPFQAIMGRTQEKTKIYKFKKINKKKIEVVIAQKKETPQPQTTELSSQTLPSKRKEKDAPKKEAPSSIKGGIAFIEIPSSQRENEERQRSFQTEQQMQEAIENLNLNEVNFSDVVFKKRTTFTLFDELQIEITDIDSEKITFQLQEEIWTVSLKRPAILFSDLELPFEREEEAKVLTIWISFKSPTNSP